MPEAIHRGLTGGNHCYFIIGGSADPMRYTSKAEAATNCQTTAEAVSGTDDFSVVNVYPAVPDCDEELDFLTDELAGLPSAERKAWMGYTLVGDNYLPDDRHSGFTYGSSERGYWPWGK